MTTKKKGRPTKLTADMKERAMELAAIGGTNASIAKELGVACSTLSLWMKDNEEFSDSLKAGKAIADDAVESALHSRACGFVGPDGVYHPPHPTACVFWLKNRRPDQWRDSSRQEITGADGRAVASRRLEGRYLEDIWKIARLWL